MTSYRQLTFKERCHLFRLLLQGRSIGWIAAATGRHRSTLYREIARNGGSRNDYQPDKADRAAKRRKQRRSKILRSPDLMTYVDSHLRKAWSPEQIAGRLKRQGAADYACHETIYRYVYSRRGLGKKLFTCLFLAKPRRTGRTTRRHRKGKFSTSRPSQSVRKRSTYGLSSATGKPIHCSSCQAFIPRTSPRSSRDKRASLSRSSRTTGNPIL